LTIHVMKKHLMIANFVVAINVVAKHTDILRYLRALDKY
jgi:hypothetical protein